MTAVTDRVDVGERLDRLVVQVEAIAEDLRLQRESWEQWHELAQTLTPVSRGAFELANRELEELSADVTVDDALRLARTLARSLPELEAVVAQMRSVTDLGTEMATLGGAGVARVSEVLAEAERKGYFAVARGGTTVLDRVVTTYADEDFDALAQRLETFLASVRESLSTTAPTPSTLGLLKRFRDPQTRRGMAHALDLLRVLGADTTTDDTAAEHVSTHQKG
jgi:hypothetical protein